MAKGIVQRSTLRFYQNGPTALADGVASTSLRGDFQIFIA